MAGAMKWSVLAVSGVAGALMAACSSNGDGADVTSGADSATGAQTTSSAGGQGTTSSTGGGGGAAGSAPTIVAASCSSADVQSAVDTAVSGDVVGLPSPCEATWDETVEIPSDKGITLDGTGATITGNASIPLISVDANGTDSTRITGFTFSTTGASNYYKATAIEVNGEKASAPFRLDHNTFIGNDASTLIDIWGNPPGLIDNNDISAKLNAEMIHNNGMGPNDTAGWEDDIVPGSPNAVYVETNVFTNSEYTVSGGTSYAGANAAIQNYYGARVVFRHNALEMTHVDVHGTGGMIGGRWWEIYNNQFTVPEDGNQADIMALRGGSGVVFGNTRSVPSSGSLGGIVMREEDTGGYPELYQIGRGKNQSLDPAYFWDNDASVTVIEGAALIQVNRDYYLSEKPGYVPFVYPYPLTAAGMPDPNG
jgi:hypothetical protein